LELLELSVVAVVTPLYRVGLGIVPQLPIICILHQCSRLHSGMVETDILPHSQSCASPEDHGLFYRLAASQIWDFNAGNLTFWYVTEMREQSSNSILAAGDQNTLLLIYGICGNPFYKVRCRSIHTVFQRLGLVVVVVTKIVV
jgi:hypothetical protein